MAGLLPHRASRGELSLGYRSAQVQRDGLVVRQGEVLRGHEFHYSRILDQPDQPLFLVIDAEGNPVPETGYVRNKVSGTFFHMIAGAH